MLWYWYVYAIRDHSTSDVIEMKFTQDNSIETVSRNTNMRIVSDWLP